MNLCPIATSTYWVNYNGVHIKTNELVDKETFNGGVTVPGLISQHSLLLASSDDERSGWGPFFQPSSIQLVKYYTKTHTKSHSRYFFPNGVYVNTGFDSFTF